MNNNSDIAGLALGYDPFRQIAYCPICFSEYHPYRVPSSIPRCKKVKKTNKTKHNKNKRRK